MGHFKRYTPAEDAVILANPGLTMEALARKVSALGEPRTALSIRGRRQHLGVTMDRTDWSAADTERLRQYWIDERLTASEIALLWPERTRASINGKTVRMKWPRTDRQCAMTPKASVLKHPRARRPGQPAPAFVAPGWRDDGPQEPTRAELLASSIESPNAKCWLERAFGECAFPVDGEGADTRSCCNPTDATYCVPHRSIMYAPTTRKASSPEPTSRKPKARDSIFSSWLEVAA